jgi:hypothetical protein
MNVLLGGEESMRRTVDLGLFVALGVLGGSCGGAASSGGGFGGDSIGTSSGTSLSGANSGSGGAGTQSGSGSARQPSFITTILSVPRRTSSEATSSSC